MWVSLCVRRWVAKEGILSPASLKRRRRVQKTFLCLFWLDKNRRTKDVSHFGAEGQSVGSETPERSVGGETPKQGVGKSE